MASFYFLQPFSSFRRSVLRSSKCKSPGPRAAARIMSRAGRLVDHVGKLVQECALADDVVGSNTKVCLSKRNHDVRAYNMVRAKTYPSQKRQARGPGVSAPVYSTNVEKKTAPASCLRKWRPPLRCRVCSHNFIDFRGSYSTQRLSCASLPASSTRQLSRVEKPGDRRTSLMARRRPRPGATGRIL